MNATIERELFTPFGLRETPDATRVSPAWLGTFFSAYLRARGRSAEAQAQVREWLEPLYARLADGRCALLPEAFEMGRAGDLRGLAQTVPPPGAAGSDDFAPSAGESVSILASAELVRVWVEELGQAPAEAERIFPPPGCLILKPPPINLFDLSGSCGLIFVTLAEWQ